MIVRARVRFESLKVSAERLALQPLNLSILCLVMGQELVALNLEERMACRPSPMSIGQGLCLPAISGGRLVTLMANRLHVWPVSHY